MLCEVRNRGCGGFWVPKARFSVSSVRKWSITTDGAARGFLYDEGIICFFLDSDPTILGITIFFRTHYIVGVLVLDAYE